jgi:hypothetical protein
MYLFDILKYNNIPNTLLKAIVDIHTISYVNKIKFQVIKSSWN